MDFAHMTAPCGLDCFNCPLFLAREDAALRGKLACLLKVSHDEAACQGCRNEGGIITFVGMTEPCSVYRCIQEKELQLCCECPDFPCDNLHPYADRATVLRHNTKVFNLCLIKKMGLEDWAQEKAASVQRTYFKGKFHL